MPIDTNVYWGIRRNIDSGYITIQNKLKIDFNSHRNKLINYFTEILREKESQVVLPEGRFQHLEPNFNISDFVHTGNNPIFPTKNHIIMMYEYLPESVFPGFILYDTEFTDRELINPAFEMHNQHKEIDIYKKETMKLIDQAYNKYSNVDYMLTQLPELRSLCTEYINEDFVPNPKKKVVSRDYWVDKVDLNKVVLFCGHLKMEGSG